MKLLNTKSSAKNTVRTAVVALATGAVALGLTTSPAAAAGKSIEADDPIGDAVVTNGVPTSEVDYLSIYGADIDEFNVSVDGDYVIVFMRVRDLQGDATISSTELNAEMTVRYLVKKATKKKKATYRTEKVTLSYTVADPNGDQGVLINGSAEDCFGTSATIDENYYNAMDIKVPVECFGDKPVQASAVGHTVANDVQSGAIIEDTIRAGVFNF